MKKLLILLLGFLTSCEQKNLDISLLQDSMSDGNVYCGPIRIFPLKLKCRDTNDTLWINTDGGSLYRDLNVFLCSYNSFSDSLIAEVEKEGFLLVDSMFFESQRKNAIIKDDTIDAIYQQEGINGLLRNYVTPKGELAASTYERLNYIIYLLYQHRVVCDLGPDPALIFHVSFHLTNKEEVLKQVLNQSKSTISICPFFLLDDD